MNVPTFIPQLLNNFSVVFLNQSTDKPFGDGLTSPTDNPVFTPTDLGATTILNSVNTILSFIITALTGLAGAFFLFQFVLGAFAWVNSGGDQKKVQESRDRITQGVIGLVLIVAAYSIMGLISTILGIEILNPGQFVQDNILNQQTTGPRVPPATP